MRSVLLSKFVPWPANSGEKRRTLALARALKSRGEVAICGFVGTNEEVQGLIDEGFEVHAVPLDRRWSKTLPGLVRGRSISAARFWDSAFDALVTEATSRPYDVLFVEHAQFQMYAGRRSPGLLIVDMQNIESSLAARVSRTKRGLLKLIYAIDAIALRRLERKALKSDAVFVVSEADRAVLDRGANRENLRVVPNGWDPVPALAPTIEPTVSFVALLSWGPNADAAVWFATHVWPLVLEHVPQARLQLVGREPASQVAALASPSVVVTGTVADLEPWYEKTLVSVAPLLAGGGSRLKILEALAAGRPVVATGIGAEGLEDLIGEGVVVADDPMDLAREIAQLLLHPSDAHALGLRGANAVSARHSWAAAVQPLITILDANSVELRTP